MVSSKFGIGSGRDILASGLVEDRKAFYWTGGKEGSDLA